MQVRILMVCLGNICRSPLAEGILDSVTSEQVYVDSAGTAGYHVGASPDPRSVAVAIRNGIDISRQRCRKFHKGDFDEFDYIFAMDRENLENLRSMARSPEDLQKLRLLLDTPDAEVLEVPDPYYGGEDGFDYVFGLIQRACMRLSKEFDTR